MPDPRITALEPARAITGGRVAILGSDFPVGLHLPVVRIGTNPARILFASSEQLDVLVSTDESGALPVQVEGVPNTVAVQVGARLATGLHQVDSPVFDRAGNLFLTYSGTRGQQVPVSIFRVVPNG